MLKEVRNFVKGSTYETKVSNEDLVRSALLLLRTLPSARQAVLEHLCNVFDEAVNSHLLQIELGKDISGKLKAFGLCTFLRRKQKNFANIYHSSSCTFVII